MDCTDKIVECEDPPVYSEGSVVIDRREDWWLEGIHATGTRMYAIIGVIVTHH